MDDSNPKDYETMICWTDLDEVIDDISSYGSNILFLMLIIVRFSEHIKETNRIKDIRLICSFINKSKIFY